MSVHLSSLREVVIRLDAIWADASDPGDLSRSRLMAANEVIGELRRRVDALQVEVAAQIAHESRPELGADSLAKQHGFRNPAQLIAAATGGSAGDAARLVQLGQATVSRSGFDATLAPPRYPAVAAALKAGALGAAAAGMIVAFLDRARIGADKTRVSEVERQLAEKAVGLSLDEVRRMVTRAQTVLEADHLEQREQERRSRRSLSMFERDGMLHLILVTDVESAAPLRAAIDGYVTAQFAARRDAVGADTADCDQRTVAMMRADALTTFCAHVSSCEGADRVPLVGATVIVRVNLDDLTSGAGSAIIDGTEQPVSISAVRRMAASGGAIPCVLSGEGEILDWGRERRLFTRAQKLALAERDGGCAMCGIPPGMTRVHHIRWWMRDAGPTDLSNGVLLCESCHHRIHDNGWEVRVDGVGVTAPVWFIPPQFVDPARTPRRGGRARWDIAA